MQAEVYHRTSTPGVDPPDLTVDIALRGAFMEGLEKSEGFGGGLLYTHIALVEGGTDIRDAGDVGNAGIVTSNTDKVYVPGYSGGTKFLVIWVEKVGGNRKVYLQRDDGVNIPWPTSYL